MATGQFPLLANRWGHNYFLLNREPTQVKNGAIVGADGVGWDPDGNGAGIFARVGGAWVRLSGTPTNISVDGGPGAEGNFNLVSGHGIQLQQSGGDVNINTLEKQISLRNRTASVTAGTPTSPVYEIADVAAQETQTLLVEFDFVVDSRPQDIDFGIFFSDVNASIDAISQFQTQDLTTGAVLGHFSANASLTGGDAFRVVGSAFAYSGSDANEITCELRMTRDSADATYNIGHGVVKWRLLDQTVTGS